MATVDLNPIPQSHKALVRERIKKASKSEFVNWNEIRDSFKVTLGRANRIR